jgi:hypothetical protein
MLATTLEPVVAEMNTASQNETLPSDVEISRRVMAIRSGWTVNERIERRRVADERFENLLDALCLAEAA